MTDIPLGEQPRNLVSELGIPSRDLLPSDLVGAGFDSVSESVASLVTQKTGVDLNPLNTASADITIRGFARKGERAAIGEALQGQERRLAAANNPVSGLPDGWEFRSNLRTMDQLNTIYPLPPVGIGNQEHMTGRTVQAVAITSPHKKGSSQFRMLNMFRTVDGALDARGHVFALYKDSSGTTWEVVVMNRGEKSNKVVVKQNGSVYEVGRWWNKKPPLDKAKEIMGQVIDGLPRRMDEDY